MSTGVTFEHPDFVGPKAIALSSPCRAQQKNNLQNSHQRQTTTGCHSFSLGSIWLDWSLLSLGRAGRTQWRGVPVGLCSLGVPWQTREFRCWICYPSSAEEPWSSHSSNLTLACCPRSESAGHCCCSSRERWGSAGCQRSRLVPCGREPFAWTYM